MPAIIAVFCTSIIAIGAFSWFHFFPEPLTNTTWSCNSFTQYSGYGADEEKGVRHEYDTLIFLSDAHARLIKRGFQQNDGDRQRGYQIDYVVNYQQYHQQLNLQFSDVDWVWGDIASWRRSVQSHEGVSAVFNYKRDGNHLFLWTGKHGNRMVCSRYIEDNKELH
ncbi:hypothetical protein CS022_05645 [Veronia nyctiphanis]|uniref:Uncharacterized protein n=1 Tax=Veronia nyctiphanis TaxID=1278244 RepID=A0A4Q0YYG6_9GAMM|nr:hypothetical protein [Veronia nyctiphanis]RXJ74111.1 hypothetical protein CS022_05645 [Veronia nyctiphanis]